MELELLKKREFGKDRFYAQNKVADMFLKEILKRKSFTSWQIAVLADCGVEIKITEPVDDIYKD